MAAPERCGLITRRVCWDLLQRLLNWARGTFEMEVLRHSAVQENTTENGQLATTESNEDSDGDMPPLSGGEEEEEEEEVV